MRSHISQLARATTYSKILCHDVWKSRKKSHLTLRAKRATVTIWVDKSWLKTPSFLKSQTCGQTVLPDRSFLIGQKRKMPKFKNSNATFSVIFKLCEAGENEHPHFISRNSDVLQSNKTGEKNWEGRCELSSRFALCMKDMLARNGMRKRALGSRPTVT